MKQIAHRSLTGNFTIFSRSQANGRLDSN